MLKYYKTITCLMMFVMLTALKTTAQNTGGGDNKVVVKGKVIDKKKKEPILGASVTEVDADGRIIKGTSTDVEGNFVIRITNPKNKLTVSYIGFKSSSQSIGSRTTINFSMEDGSSDMGEVIVVAGKKTDNGILGINERNSTLAASKISAKEMEEMQAASIDQALQGRLAGVDITASSGDPGAAMNIRIRGVSTISSNGNPLIVVDGMPIETEIPSDFNFGSADEQGYAQLLNISPADIKEITVLKDAAATAMWGSRAANGVLLITTKRGTVGKPSISYTFKGSVSQVPKAIPLLSGNQYSTLIPEGYMNRIGTPLPTTVREFNYDPNDPYWYSNYSNNTNWIDAITRTGALQNHSLSMVGGGEKARYYASVDYFNQTGVTLGTGFKRLTSRINLDYNISEKIKIFTSISYTHSDQDRSYLGSNASNAESGIRAVAYAKMPNQSVFEYDEQGNVTPNYFSPFSNIQGTYSRIYNPVAMATQAKYGVLSDRVMPRFQVNYDIIKSVLRTSFDVQFDINNTKNNSFLPQIATGRNSTETVVNRAYDGDMDQFIVNTKIQLAYTPQFKNPDHSFISSFTTFTEDQKVVNQESVTSNTASSLLVDPSIASRTQNSDLMSYSGTSQTRTIGAVVDAQYGFKDKYMLNAAIRGDGNSRFGPNYRYGYFPSVSFRWRVSGENFLHNVKQIDDLSFRASYGKSGVAPKYDYTFYSNYSTYSWGYLGQSAVYPATMELKNLRWQTINGTNIGANLSMFGGRVRVDAEVYRNRTKDLYMNGLSIASFTGYSSVNMNIGTMDNQGWEIGIWTTPYKSKDWSVSFDFNVAHNDNIIRSLSEYYPNSKGDVTKLGDYLRLIQPDHPFGSFYGYKYKGVYADKNATLAQGNNGKPIVGPNGQTVYMRFNYPNIDYIFQPGDAMYEDVNHDGNINYMDVVYLGNSNPKLTGGFGPSLTWKNKLKVSTFFSFRYDFDVINRTKMNSTNMYYFDNQSTATLRRWRKEGDVTDIPRALIGGGYNWLGSDRYVEDASYLRFRTVTVRYTVDNKVLSKFKMKSLSAYVTAENLFTITKYTGQDPEISASGSDPFRLAFDDSMTPPTRVFTIGLVAGF
jgi:TonB-linked SusC/RagA family outer membrane protein